VTIGAYSRPTDALTDSNGLWTDTDQ